MDPDAYSGLLAFGKPILASDLDPTIIGLPKIRAPPTTTTSPHPEGMRRRREVLDQ